MTSQHRPQASTQPATPGSPAASAHWRAEADQRIERLRKGDFTLTAADAQGRPLAGAKLRLRQVRSHYRFGTCISTDLSDSSADEQRYRQFIIDHFNAVVDENFMKWYSTERQRGRRDYRRADGHLAFAQSHGLAMRGHCLFWAKEKFVARQPWLLELEGDELRQAMEEHLASIVPRYRGKLIAWDVNNEMLDGHWYRDRLGEGIRPWMFKRAAEFDPDTPLFVNEYSILGNPARVEQYIELIRSLQQAGAPVGGIGIQEHACERFVLDAASESGAGADADSGGGAEAGHEERAASHHVTPRQVLASLDRLGELGLPIHLTEISARTPDAGARADALEAILRIGYSHPAVEAVMLWGFWSRRHWLGPDAALADDDFKLTPAGERIAGLLLDQWRTRMEGWTDQSGTLHLRGYFGDYEVEVTPPAAAPFTRAVSLVPGQTTATVAPPA